MGFFVELGLHKKYKRGVKHAKKGNFNEAISLFDEVFLSASDLKLQAESLTWLHICKSLRYAKGGDFISGKKEYQEHLSAIRDYIEICNTTPGFGTEARVNTWKDSLKDFLSVYYKQIDLLK